ncbi:MAG: hypothetical protein KIG36_00395, partial [Eubacteriales bacterium]|nr:hypothetical protein [Eubacteriales bacterium]
NVNVFLRELMSHLRDVLLVRVSRGADCRDVVGCSEEVYARLRKQASDASAAALERAIGILADTEIALARFSRPRILLELALLKICRPEDERESVQALETRLGALETTVRSGVVAVSAAQQAAPARTSPAPETAEPSAPTTEPPRVSRDYAGVYAELLKLVRKQKISLLAMLKAANGGELLGERFILEFPSEDEAFCQALMRPQNKSFLEESIKTITGKSYDLTCRVGSDAASPIEEVFALLGGGKPELDTAKTSSSYDDLFDEKESYDEFIEPDEYDDGRTEEEENG